MSRKTAARSIVAFGFLALSVPTLLVSAPPAWRQWRDYCAARKALLARSENDRRLDSIRARMTDLEARKAILSSQAAESAAALEGAEKKLMPMEADASRLLKLDLLTLAVECGLSVEEMRPIQADGRNCDPESAARGEGGKRPAAGEAGAIAFLGKPPAGEVYRRPLMLLRCRAKYARVCEFFERLQGLRWQVAPAAFSIGRTSAAEPAAVPADGETPDSAAAVQWSAGDDLLHLTVVLGL